MIETLKNVFDLVVQFINSIFDFKIELIEGQEVSIGIIIVAFVFIVVALYLILKAMGVIGGDD